MTTDKTLRDEIAMAVLPRFLTEYETPPPIPNRAGGFIEVYDREEWAAKKSYEYADAMMKEREGK